MKALIGARARLDPAAGVMVSGLWVVDAGQLVLIVHHLAIDAVSWRIVLDDLNTAWAQHRSGQPVVLPATGTSFARWAGLLVEYARRREVVGWLMRGSRWRGHRRCCRRRSRRWIPMPVRGICRCHWMPRPAGCCSVRCPRRFMPGSKTSC